jgi:alkaline phosphatase
MKVTSGTLLFVFFTLQVVAQNSKAYLGHSHNDYLQKKPFKNAFDLRFGSIEVDVFEKEKVIYVAHEKASIEPYKTLEKLYLNPIDSLLRTQKAYSFQLLIDLKEAKALSFVIDLINNYPLIKKHLTIVISGEMPNPKLFNKYPKWLFFDGRLGMEYSQKEIKKIGLISENIFNVIGPWPHDNIIKESKLKLLNEIIEQTHNTGKKIRFWNTPNSIEAYTLLKFLGVDYIGTDDLELLNSILIN